MTASSDMNIALRRAFQKKGQALPPKETGGAPRFPIGDSEDVRKAVGLVGQVPDSEKPMVRRHIIRNAKKPYVGGIQHIPADWNVDGSIKK